MLSPLFVTSALDNDWGIEHDRPALTWLNNYSRRPDAGMCDCHALNQPRSVGLFYGRPFERWPPAVGGSSARRTSFAGNSERSSRDTRIMTSVRPARPGSMVTSAIASAVWMCTKAASGGMPTEAACTCAAGGSVPRMPTNSSTQSPRQISAKCCVGDRGTQPASAVVVSGKND